MDHQWLAWHLFWYQGMTKSMMNIAQRYVVLCYVMWCDEMWCGVVWCGVLRCGAVRCGAVLCCAVRCCAMLCYVMFCYVTLCYVLCYDMLCYAMLCYVMLCYVLLRYVMLCVMLCYVMLCYVMLCYVMLCYVISLSYFDNSELRPFQRCNKYNITCSFYELYQITFLILRVLWIATKRDIMPEGIIARMLVFSTTKIASGNLKQWGLVMQI